MVFASVVATTGQLSGRCERTKWSPSELDWVREPRQCFTNSEITKVFAMGQVDEPDIFGKGKKSPCYATDVRRLDPCTFAIQRGL